jgi:hypothetical protein
MARDTFLNERQETLTNCIRSGMIYTLKIIGLLAYREEERERQRAKEGEREVTCG